MLVESSKMLLDSPKMLLEKLKMPLEKALSKLSLQKGGRTDFWGAHFGLRFLALGAKVCLLCMGFSYKTLRFYLGFT